MNKKILMGVGLAASVLGAPGAFAELSDPPYFNLWTEGTVHGGLTGNGTEVRLCGTSTCDPTVQDGDGNLTHMGYAIFKVEPVNTGAGSGNIDPFLRFQHNEAEGLGSSTTEAAFNTNYRSDTSPTNTGTIEYQKTSGNSTSTETMLNQAKDTNAFNHVIKWSDLMVDDDGYVSFLLDINEPGGGKETLRLDELAIFVGTSATANFLTRDIRNKENNGQGTLDNVAKVTLEDTNDPNAIFKPIWDMDYNVLANGTPVGDGTNYGGINVSNINDSGKAGSGDYDMRMMLHKQLFLDGIAAIGGSPMLGADDAYIYLYNFAGQADSKKPCTEEEITLGSCSTEAQAGFEEWAAEVNTTPPPPPGVPEPSTALLMAGGLIGMMRAKKIRRNTMKSA